MTIDNTIQKPFPIQKLIENGGPYSSLVLEYLSVEDRLAFTRTSKTIHQLAPFQYLPREIEDKFGQVPGPKEHAAAEARRILNEKKLSDLAVSNGEKFPFVSPNDFVVSSLEERFQGNLWTRLIQKVRYYTGYEYAILAKRLAEMAKSKLAEFNAIENNIPSPVDTIRKLRNSLVRAYSISKEIERLFYTRQHAYAHFVNHKNTLPGLMKKIAQMAESCLFKFIKVEDDVQAIANIQRELNGSGVGFNFLSARSERLLAGKTQSSPDNRFGFELLNIKYKDLSIGMRIAMDGGHDHYTPGEAPRIFLLDLEKESSANGYRLGRIRLERKRDRPCLVCHDFFINLDTEARKQSAAASVMIILLLKFFAKSKATTLVLGWHDIWSSGMANVFLNLQIGFKEIEENNGYTTKLHLDKGDAKELLIGCGKDPLLPDREDFLPSFW